MLPAAVDADEANPGNQPLAPNDPAQGVRVPVQAPKLLQIPSPGELRFGIVPLLFKGNDQVEIIGFSGLLVDLAKDNDATILIRGLRVVADFEYEFQLVGMNRKLNSNIETLFLMSDVENQIISSKFVKEIIKLKGDIKKFTTKSTIKLLKEKYE